MGDFSKSWHNQPLHLHVWNHFRDRLSWWSKPDPMIDRILHWGEILSENIFIFMYQLFRGIFLQFSYVRNYLWDTLYIVKRKVLKNKDDPSERKRTHCEPKTSKWCSLTFRLSSSSKKQHFLSLNKESLINCFFKSLFSVFLKWSGFE